MKRIILPISTLFFSVSIFGQVTTTENYIQTRTYLEPVTVTSPAAKQSQTVQYFDGLGRSKQVVNVKATPLQQDLVTAVRYDGFGRQEDFWLAAPMSTLNGGIQTAVDATAQTYYNDVRPFTHQNLEKSPLNRPLSNTQTGTVWESHPVQFKYESSETNDHVKKLVATTTWADDATNSKTKYISDFGPGQLYKNTTIDEDGNTTIEFKNGQGQIVLSRKVISSIENADTYYVYNEYDELVLVVSPRAIFEFFNEFGAGMDDEIPDNILNNLCYQYKYDRRNRVVEKKMPGKGWESILYDKQNRVVATQDQELKNKGQWLYTKYDQFGRIAITGIGTGGNRATEQVVADTYGSNNVNRLNAPSFARQGMDVYYGNQDNTYPNSTRWVTLLSLNYYDTYPGYGFNPSFPSDILGEAILTGVPDNNGLSTKGLPVMSTIKNIEDDNWTKNYSYYDRKSRLIRTYSINHLGGRTKIDSKLDFVGITLQTITTHKGLDTDTDKVIIENFTYDSQNRLLSHRHKVDNNSEEYLTQNEYNELSQLKNKKVGGTIANSGIQSIDYQYNLRGWLTNINDIENLNDKKFAYQIKYDSPETTPFSKKKYNGNITEVNWRTSTDDIFRRYQYGYDNLNRMTYSIFSEPKLAIPYKYLYGEDVFYDLNGNITTLLRTGDQYSPTELIDDLTYQYNGNQIVVIYDYSQNPSGYPGGGNVISYDNNGNMKNMPDKGITSIVYNYLNLPSNIVEDTGFEKNTFKYTYNANGTKLKKEIVSTLSSQVRIVYYIDGFQYDNKGSLCFNCPTTQPILKFIPTSEGYYNFENNKYIYNYTDHLGNVRLSFQQNGSSTEVLEENNYYAFGLKHTAYNILQGNPSYNYKYNGKELQETGMYDYGARFYMPDIVRTPQIDPLTEKMPEWSPYSYAFNNPIRNTDPTGMEPEDVINGDNEESRTLKEPSQCCWGMFRFMPLLEGGSNIKPTVIEVATKTGETAGKTSESLAKTSEGAQKSNERVRYQNEVERAKDKMDGINRAQENLKRSAPQGSKQNAIQSTKKSQQNLNNALRRIDLSSMDEFDVKVTPTTIKKDNISVPKPRPVQPTFTPKKSAPKPEPQKPPVDDYYRIYS
ncbi:RHS repeat domain-containing protein [Chryseobacterium salviniae]|uniref:DUF6443 domain-containing protein n=1 Tax=Chryseobacterium salviniae TaxID=3101750 RepID=A0ABU6HT12_9FLAO|nr:DUF6443 domain-containing protein [Chryseobacterium sp. T9W2-O]MEC3875816.1 DUF6443 domain-containing protein [Chryseobacterium sp. T9W2-O]